MGLGRTIKFAIFEVLQFAGLCLPLLIIMQRFAAIIAKVKTSARPPGDGTTAYWLIVASSIAYVTSIALLIWVPLKSLVFMKKKFLVGRKNWWVSAEACRGSLLYVACSSPSATLMETWAAGVWTGLWNGLDSTWLVNTMSKQALQTLLSSPPLLFLSSLPSVVPVTGGRWPSFMWSSPHYPALPFSSPALRYNLQWTFSDLSLTVLWM